MYSRNDITLLGKSQQTQLDAAVAAVVQQQHEQGLFAEQLMLCAPGITLHNAFELLSANQKVLHLVCVDDAQLPVGIVSISDIFAYFGADTPPAAAGLGHAAGSVGVGAGAGTAGAGGVDTPRGREQGDSLAPHKDSWTGQDIRAMAEV